MSRIVFLTALLHGAVLSFAEIPILRSNTKNISIRDGANLKVNFWYLVPSIKPDIYHVDYPKKNQFITFISDIDTLTFEVKENQIYDFYVLYKGTDSCLTRISGTLSKNFLDSPSKKNDTIPFTIKDHRIYLHGYLNKSKKLNVQFDLGAGGMGLGVINDVSVPKVKIHFNKKTTQINSDGTHEVRLSSDNELVIGDLIWKGIDVLETRNMENYEDLIIGNGMFRNKIYEINYDKKILVIFNSAPFIANSYRKIPMRIDQECPLIEGRINFNGQSISTWFVFDTGYSGAFRLGEEFSKVKILYQSVKTWFGFGDNHMAIVPLLSFSNFDFKEVLGEIEKPESKTKRASIIGNVILKKFNVFIDNQQGFIYLKPNHYFSENYHKNNTLLFVPVIGVILLIISILIFYFFRKKSKILQPF